MDALEESALRPRQVRIQAALRPDMTGKIDSKARREFVPLPAFAEGVRSSHKR